MPFIPPVWDRVRIALGVLVAELAIVEWAAKEAQDAELFKLADELRATITKLEQHPQLQTPPQG